jgi:hypothetical protein
MDESDLPPCGLYVTRVAIASVPAGRLVYFHNHGDPGPGIYLPSGWTGNRARFEARGHTLPSLEDADGLEPLSPEGFYRVAAAFTCCPKECRRFEPDELVQLGYNGAAQPILFTPQLGDGGLSVPDRGISIDPPVVEHLRPLKVARPATPTPGDPTLLH